MSNGDRRKKTAAADHSQVKAYRDSRVAKSTSKVTPKQSGSGSRKKTAKKR